jgi:hypothetical protein
MNNTQNNKLFAGVGIGLEMGFLIALPLVMFLLAGLWLDKKFQTIPLFTIVFIIISLASVVVELRYIIMPLLEKRSQKKSTK